jgi:pyruvate/2-oxoglutarate dehydrogenase complex dihydrolipoamide dehydrogenase (E3) component
VEQPEGQAGMTVQRFDIAVIGAGSGGLSVAAAAAQFGQRVVLFERAEMGGDCLNSGCIPSKALLAAAKQAQAMRGAARFGIAAVEPKVDYAAVMAHVQRAIAAIAPNDSQQRFEALGVTVIRAAARFTGPGEIEAAGQRFTARRFVIATGSSPAIPAIPGIGDVPFLTNETLFCNHVLPSHLLVIGAGPVGLEMAQAHARLGSRVTVVEAGTPLARSDAELAGQLLDQLRREGITILAGQKIRRLAARDGGIAMDLESGETLSASHLLVAAGRRPNIEGLGLEAAGVGATPHGIGVDRAFRTSNHRIHAIGDVAGGRFTHEAGHQAGVVIRHSLFNLTSKPAAIPRVIYTDPEFAEAGLTEAEALAGHGTAVKVLRWPFHDNDRAQAEAAPQGMVKIVTGRRGRILGVAILAPGAGELIQPWILAIARGLKASAMVSPVLPYPTRGEAGKRAALTYYAGLASNPLIRRITRVIGVLIP